MAKKLVTYHFISGNNYTVTYHEDSIHLVQEHIDLFIKNQFEVITEIGTVVINLKHVELIIIEDEE